MSSSKGEIRTRKVNSLFKWLLWIQLTQLALINLSVALYAYKLTHFYPEDNKQTNTHSTIFSKTWLLFAGPKYYKLTVKEFPSFPFERIQLITDDGYKIDGWYGNTDQAKGCVLFFHGITTNKSILLAEAARFKNLGYNVLLIDFRGHGNSNGRYTSFGVEETAEVEAAFNFARSRNNKKIILYGSSLGAVVILKAVHDKKVKPEALIADMPFASLHDHIKARIKSFGFPEQPFSFLVTGWLGLEQGYNGYKHNTCTYAREVHCPVLLQWGAKDYLVTRKETDSIFSCLSSSNKKLVIYSAANHELLLQHDPLTWQREVNLFLARLPP